MKKQIIMSVFILLVAGGYVIQKSMKKSSDFPNLMLSNMEALATPETDTKDYWCCGNTDTCVKGSNFEIKGKFQESPCK